MLPITILTFKFNQYEKTIDAVDGYCHLYTVNNWLRERTG